MLLGYYQLSYSIAAKDTFSSSLNSAILLRHKILLAPLVGIKANIYLFLL